MWHKVTFCPPTHTVIRTHKKMSVFSSTYTVRILILLHAGFVSLINMSVLCRSLQDTEVLKLVYSTMAMPTSQT